MERKWRALFAFPALAAVGLTAFRWWTPILSFLDTHKGMIATIAAAVAILGGVAAASRFFLGWLGGGAGPASRRKLRAARRAYLDYLGNRYRHLDLKGMGVSDRVALRLPLAELYVPLKARPELPDADTWDRKAQVAGRTFSPEEAERLERRVSEPRLVSELVRENEGLIILGDPGSGKTTFLKHLAVALAGGDELGLSDRLPILVPLSAFAKALAGADVRLDEFIGDYVHGLGGHEALKELLKAELSRGRALLLLDGLDEVRDPGLRQTVIRRVVDFFSFHRQAGNRFVMTSRIVGYKDVRTVAEGLAECTLVDFADEEIEAFVAGWTAALERQALGETTVAAADAERERRELLEAIGRNPGVRRLAGNPLLLTILALMKRQGISLPERRVQLYDRYVETLIFTWNRARGLGRPPARDLDVVETVRILAPLALWMHEVNPGLGLVRREELHRRLGTIYRERGEDKPESCARQFMEDLREYAGLLLERGAGEYGFIHLTFEEYLAAVAIAREAQGDPGRMAGELARRVEDPAWREVSLLLIGYVGLIQQLEGVAGSVLERLVTDPPGPPGQAAVLAGEALLDVGFSAVTPSSRRAVVDALVETMQDGAVEAVLRRQAGLELGRLGWLPEDLDAFVEVPRGPFLYGDGKEERVIKERYWIARYPVTNVQYARFVEDGGYAREELWSTEGWRWRTENDRNEPWSRGVDFENPIFPRIGVTWYEADAYCRWLSSRGIAFEIEGTGEVEAAAKYRARLPTEEEWERAARGEEGLDYPWGKEFDVYRSNTEESDTKEKVGIGTTAVCTYPQGASPARAWDMSGNVLEWTSSKLEKSRYLFCGGSYYHNKKLARCAARYRRRPGSFNRNSGFRVVLSLANSEC
ncbi:MAG: SUMF1/EgtB/PvdO family nonheme iron enzyme [bacterium]|nr:SUMF1/EgtB/PvdO family nonheme iron enzyme [bacterium]